jgi:hypothetical protein
VSHEFSFQNGNENYPESIFWKWKWGRRSMLRNYMWERKKSHRGVVSFSGLSCPCRRRWGLPCDAEVPFLYWFEDSNKQAGGAESPQKWLCADGEDSCGYESAHTKSRQAIRTLCEWMTLLISLPSRGGTQLARLQTNFAITFCGWKLVSCTHPITKAKLLWLAVVPLLRQDS